MAWRETLLYNFGPGILGGIKFVDWLRLLHENRWRVSPACLPRVLAITQYSLQNSLWGGYENLRYGGKLRDVVVPPPLFVLGHWRSGTTHLHNLLVADKRFAFPNNYQAMFPHTFLTTEAIGSRLSGGFLPKRRPMDNLEWTMQSPQEDEFALGVASGKSPCLGWVFPGRRGHYDRYLTLRDIPAGELAAWQAALRLFLKKLTWKHQRPLVLKSPPHTGRIKVLLEMFPQAKFLHVHRDPYAVFCSTRHMFRVNHRLNCVQRSALDDLDDWILRQYRQMYDAFFEERSLIPPGQYAEVGFEQLEADPLGEMQRIYQSLSLPDFSAVEPALQTYVASIANYKKNEFSELPAALRSQIAERWRPCFEEWGYNPK